MERKSGDDWVSACRNGVVAGVRGAGRGRKTWYECAKDDRKELGLHAEWAVFRDMRGASYREERLTLAERGKMDVLKINDDNDDEGGVGSP